MMTWLLQEQYIFVYEALLEALKAGETTIPNSAFRATYEELCNQRTEDGKRTWLEEQFQVSHVTTVPNSAFRVTYEALCSQRTEDDKRTLLEEQFQVSHVTTVPNSAFWPLIG